MEDRCVVCGDKIPEGRQVCPRCSGNEGTAFEKLMQNKDVQFEIDDRIEAAYHQGFEAGYSQLETKYWDSQRLIDQYAAENKALKEMLKKALETIADILNSAAECSACKYYNDETTECDGSENLMCREQCEWEYADEAWRLIGGDTE